MGCWSCQHTALVALHRALNSCLTWRLRWPLPVLVIRCVLLFVGWLPGVRSETVGLRTPGAYPLACTPSWRGVSAQASGDYYLSGSYLVSYLVSTLPGWPWANARCSEAAFRWTT